MSLGLLVRYESMKCRRTLVCMCRIALAFHSMSLCKHSEPCCASFRAPHGTTLGTGRRVCYCIWHQSIYKSPPTFLSMHHPLRLLQVPAFAMSTSPRRCQNPVDRWPLCSSNAEPQVCAFILRCPTRTVQLKLVKVHNIQG